MFKNQVKHEFIKIRKTRNPVKEKQNKYQLRNCSIFGNAFAAQKCLLVRQ